MAQHKVPKKALMAPFFLWLNASSVYGRVGTKTPFPRSLQADSSCYPDARTVKIQSTTGEVIHIFEFQALSLDDVNVALNQSASQSSQFTTKVASNAVDGDLTTFSHTSSGDLNSFWQVDLGSTSTLKSVQIKNRYCTSDPTDPNECLCRLSHAAVSLLNELNEVVATKTIGDTCGVHDISLDLSTCTTPAPTGEVVPTLQPTGGVIPVPTPTDEVVPTPQPTGRVVPDVPLITFSDAIVASDDSFEITFNNPLDQTDIYAAVVSNSYCTDANSSTQVDSTSENVAVGSSSVTLSQNINDLITADQRNSGSAFLEFCLRADVHTPSFPSSLVASKISLGITVNFEDESNMVLGGSSSSFTIEVVTADFTESSVGYTTQREINVDAILGECATPGNDGPYAIGSTLKFCVKSTDSDVIISSLKDVSFTDLDGIPILGITDSIGEPSFVTNIDGLETKEVDVSTMMATTIFDQGFGGSTINVQGTVSVTYIDQAPDARRRQLKTEETQPFAIKIAVGESDTQAELYYSNSAAPAGNPGIGAIIAGITIVGLVVISVII